VSFNIGGHPQPPYPIFRAMVATGTASSPVTEGALPLTETEVQGNAQPLGTTSDDAAVSLVYFNNFRINLLASSTFLT